MRLLLLITDLELGGTPTVVRELAIRLHNTGVNVEVACLSNWGPVADQLRDAGITVTALNARGPFDLRILVRLIRLIRSKQFTTVFSFLVHANAMAAVASLVVPDVRWLHAMQNTQPKPAWHWPVQQIAAMASEIIVVPSASVAQLATDWAGVPEEKIVIIPNAIDLTVWQACKSTIPAADTSAAPIRPYPITFLGRLDPIKDVPTLIEAVAMLSPLVHLHIYGQGRDQVRIEQTIARFAAPVTLHGSTDAPHHVLQQSGVLVLPSLAEGFGLVLIEAMAAGVPIVATNVAGIRDVIRHEETGLLVPPQNPRALADAIQSLAENPTLRHRLVTTAKQEVQSRYTWDRVLIQYQQLLLGERGV